MMNGAIFWHEAGSSLVLGFRLSSVGAGEFQTAAARIGAAIHGNAPFVNSTAKLAVAVTVPAPRRRKLHLRTSCWYFHRVRAPRG